MPTDPVRRNEVDIRIRESDRSPTISIFWQRSWHSWVNQGVSLPRIRLLAARQTAQGALFCKQPAHGERSSASSLA